MSVYKRGDTYHFEFIFAGKRIRESAHTASKTVAKIAEQNRRRELEKALSGMPVEERGNRIRSVTDVIGSYSDGYDTNHRPKTVIWSKGCLSHLRRLLGTCLIPDLTETVVREYMTKRKKEGASGRTINMEVGELSRAIGGTWKQLWPRLKKLDERSDIGRALTPEEESRLLTVLGETKSQNGQMFVRLALLTGMRSGEILDLTWKQIDFRRRTVTVGIAKTAAGSGREIPMNEELNALLSVHADWFTSKFGTPDPSWYVFPFGSPRPSDPTRPATTMKTFWENAREKAGIRCRFHDLRHSVATKMAEAGVSESTMKALLGHMSRNMLERYSHIRLKAKREAVESLTTAIQTPISGVVPTKVPTVAESVSVQ
jgi:integrase